MSDREKIWEDKRKDALGSDFSFFTRWSLLVGGTIISLTTLLESLSRSVVYAHKSLYCTEGLLFFSFLTSLAGLVFSDRLTQKRMVGELYDARNPFYFDFKNTYEIKEILKLAAVGLYIIGIAFLVYFANVNLLR